MHLMLMSVFRIREVKITDYRLPSTIENVLTTRSALLFILHRDFILVSFICFKFNYEDCRGVELLSFN